MPKSDLTSNQFLAKVYLEEEGFLDISDETEKSLTMSKEFIVNGISKKIIAYIDCDFPIEYPKYFIKDTSLYLNYPHIEISRIFEDCCSICLIEEDKKVLYKNPSELLYDSYSKLNDFINDLNDGVLTQEDIFDEFDSYWKSGINIHYNKNYLKNHTTFKIVDAFISESDDLDFLIIDKQKVVEKFYTALNRKTRKEKILYINLEKKFPKKIPQTYGEFIQAIKDIGYYNSIVKLKKNKNLYRLILFSITIPNTNEIHFAAIHIKHLSEELSNGITPLNKFLNISNSNKKIETVLAKDISSQRIYTRGGEIKNMEINKKDKTIAIIGCGSVGASLAYKLNKIGCTNLLLVDPDNLCIDNISRHLLGMEYEKKNKAEALKMFLEKQFIYSNIESIPQYVENDFDKIKSSDLIITALGSEASHIEELIINKAIDGELPPVISCWLEANAVAGHSILFDNTIDSSTFELQSLFNDISILKQEYASSLKKDDVGCNSSYMPYSFINSDQHINHFARMVIEQVLEKEFSPIWSSLANIDEYEEHLKVSTDIRPHSIVERTF